MQTNGIWRVLIIHPDEGLRRSLADQVRRCTGGSASTHEASAASEALELARKVGPRVIFLDLDAARGVALDAARALRRADRVMVGLYNPLTSGGGEGRMLREAARAGFGDFIAIPPAESEVAAVLAGAASLAEAPEREGRVVAFYSHKGGAGVTTLAVSTALAMKNAGADDVVLAELKPMFGDLAGMLALRPERDMAGLVADLDRPGPIESYCLRESHSGLAVLPGPADPAAGAAISPEQVGRAVIALRRRFPWVVLDLPASLDLLTLGALDLAETVCLVTEASTATLQQTAALLRVLAAQGFGPERVRVLVNRHDLLHGGPNAREVAEALGRKVDAQFGFDPHVAEAAENGELLVLNNPKMEFVKAVNGLARGLLGGTPVGA